jgi:hypothetical protein
MKVVINKCPNNLVDRFQLSDEAMKQAIENGASGIVVTEEANTPVVGKDAFRDVGDGYSAGLFRGMLYKDGKIYTFDDFLDAHRADPVLVKIVEQMGHAANGERANLHVVEIPDGVRWKIEEEDNDETIVLLYP